MQLGMINGSTGPLLLEANLRQTDVTINPKCIHTRDGLDPVVKL